MAHSKMVVICFCLNMLLIVMAIGTSEEIYSTHENVSVGRFKNTSMCDVYALTPDKKIFQIKSDGHHIDPPCSLYLIGVNNINNTYSLSGMCFNMSDISLPCGRNDTLVLREWTLDIRHQNQSILLFSNESMLVTEKTLRCDIKPDFSMNYEFCREKISMLEILFYSRNQPSSDLPKITVQSHVLIGQTYPALSLDVMETMTIQMDVQTSKTCKAKAQQIHLDFLDRVILIGNDNNTNNNIFGMASSDEYHVHVEKKMEKTVIDLNVILPSLFGSIATVASALIAVRYKYKWSSKKPTDHIVLNERGSLQSDTFTTEPEVSASLQGAAGGPEESELQDSEDELDTDDDTRELLKETIKKTKKEKVRKMKRKKIELHKEIEKKMKEWSELEELEMKGATKQKKKKKAGKKEEQSKMAKNKGKDKGKSKNTGKDKVKGTAKG